jgi:glycosyltransferase involved in cell wall biosynthesis
MLRVLRILNRLAVGGPVLNAAYLTKYLAPEYETMLVVGERESHEKSADFITGQLGISYTTIGGMSRSINPISDYKAYGDLKKLIKTFRPHIVHTHAAKPGAIGRLAASASDVPVIVHTFHGHVFHSYFNRATSRFYIETERFLARRSDAIVAISNQQKQELTEVFHIAPEEKVRVIPLGFDLDRFQVNQSEKRQAFRREFGLQEDEIAIGIVGRLVPIKNHPFFLEAVHYVLTRTSKKVRAFIIGDGETRASLERMALEKGIPFSTEKDRVHTRSLVFTSWRSDVDVITAGLDVVCLTSFNEGTPVSLIEAQAANKPIVATRVGGIQDIVLEGKTALLSDSTDSRTFASHLLRLVEDDALRNRLGAASSSYVMQRFSYHRLVNDMASLYKELLEKKHPSR